MTTPNQMTTKEVAANFNDLAQQERWFDIQDLLFSDDVKSIDPANSPYFGYAEGRAAVRRKGEEFIACIQGFHGASTTEPLITGDYFAVGRELDVTVKPHGRVQISQIMLYQVKEGKIVSEQFFY